jgi:hypothetical protein
MSNGGGPNTSVPSGGSSPGHDSGGTSPAVPASGILQHQRQQQQQGLRLSIIRKGPDPGGAMGDWVIDEQD